MSFLVKGMEMPHSCGDCVLCRPKGPYPCYCYIKQFPIKPSETDLRDGLCPLAEVPTPHGRLKDADVLIEQIREEGINQAESYANRNHPVVRAYGDCYGKVVDAPTIIEAEGGND